MDNNSMQNNQFQQNGMQNQQNNQFQQNGQMNQNMFNQPVQQVPKKKKHIGLIILGIIAILILINVFKNKISESILIFVLPPSMEELEKRIKNRNLDSEEVINNRLKIARDEIKLSSKYDYVVTNNKIEDTVKKLKMIIDNEKN